MKTDWVRAFSFHIAIEENSSKRKKIELKGKFKWKKLTVFWRALPTKMYQIFPRPEHSVGRGEKFLGILESLKSRKSLKNEKKSEKRLQCKKWNEKSWKIIQNSFKILLNSFKFIQIQLNSFKIHQNSFIIHSNSFKFIQTGSKFI